MITRPSVLDDPLSFSFPWFRWLTATSLGSPLALGFILPENPFRSLIHIPYTHLIHRNARHLLPLLLTPPLTVIANQVTCPTPHQQAHFQPRHFLIVLPAGVQHEEIQEQFVPLIRQHSRCLKTPQLHQILVYGRTRVLR